MGTFFSRLSKGKMLKRIGLTLLIFGFISKALAIPDQDAPIKQDSPRKEKLFSLFSVVTFPNAGCSSLDSSRNGTCYTSTECESKSGTKSGNCAAGFGVCCLFIVKDTSTTINENCTYIQNPSFPSVYDAQTALTYTVKKCADRVCSVRLDFESFTTVGPSGTLEATGG